MPEELRAGLYEALLTSRLEEALARAPADLHREFDDLRNAEAADRASRHIAEAVARAVELSVHADSVSDVAPLGADVDSLVGELEALRQGLEETGGAARAAGGS